MTMALLTAGCGGGTSTKRVLGPVAPSWSSIAEDRPRLMVGDQAPPLDVEEWIKGEGVRSVKPGQVYLVVFFGSWCGACHEAMPAISVLQEKYGGRVRVLAISIREGGPNDADYTDQTRERVRGFVARNADRMRFAVGYDGGAKHCRTAWTDAAEHSGVPTAFIVDGTGQIAHIAHPTSVKIGQVLDALLAGTFDMVRAREQYATRMREDREFKRARQLFDEGKVDDALRALDALAERSPSWAPTASFEKYQNLVQSKRYEEALREAGATLDTHQMRSLGGLSVLTSTLLALPPEFSPRAHALALRAAHRAVEMNHQNYPGPLADLAGVYWALGKRDEAIAWQRKAVDAAPSEWRKNFEPKLREYEAE